MKRIRCIELALIAHVVGSAVAIAQDDAAAVEAAARSQCVMLGGGEHRYEWVPGWGRLPDGRDLGNTHGCIVIDKKGNVYINTDTERAVVVLSPDGEFLRAWGEELEGGLHGTTLVEEDGEEFLYLAHTKHHEVYKATLDGKVLWTLGYPKEAGIYESAEEYVPTSVAVGPDGDIYVADGYGKSWVHQFDAQREYLRSWGGPGEKPGEMRTPHGIWLDTRGDEPVLVVADRENHRLQFFDLEGRYLKAVEGVLRRPCNVHQRGDDLVVADLAGRVTILDRENRLVVHLGENPDPKKWAKNGVPKSEWEDGQFISPHSAFWDRNGDLFVMDWVAPGRVTKLRRASR